MKVEDWIAVAVALYTTGIATAVAHAVVKLLTANTKNKNVKLLLGWVDEGVNFAESQRNLIGADKKAEAFKYVTSKLVGNKLENKFTTQQIDALIEKYVAELHDWKPEVK